MKKEIKERVFDFIFEMAFRDAVLRNAFRNPYNKEDAKRDEKFSALKQEIKEAAKGVVDKYADDLLDTNTDIPSVLDYIKKVHTAVQGIQCKRDDSESKVGIQSFSFGNAQKLVNMTAKYLFLTCYNGEIEQQDRFEYCHCPMDSIMIEIVKRKAKEYEKRHPKSKGKMKLNVSQGWSTLEYGDDGKEPEAYSEFQRVVKILATEEKIKPIEYDYKYWE